MSDQAIHNSMKERETLPVAQMKAEIMNAITENSVIIIRGNTGCGKTTQVNFLLLNLMLIMRVLLYYLCFLLYMYFAQKINLGKQEGNFFFHAFLETCTFD